MIFTLQAYEQVLKRTLLKVCDRVVPLCAVIAPLAPSLLACSTVPTARAADSGRAQRSQQLTSAGAGAG